ncbi:MAG: hypothetical protein ACJ77Z_19505 [Thermoleophilaceae bacterium]
MISMGGPQPLRQDNQPNDYRTWANRRYVEDSGTTWVKLWVSWYDLQHSYQPTSQADSWRDLDAAPSGEAWLRRLDGQIKAANDDGIGVIVTVYQAFPTWASGATGPDPLSSKGPERKLPVDLSANGPWGWFVGHLSARYNGSYNAIGPHAPGMGETSAAWFGNPDRARADALEIVNEPNTLYWPMDDIVGVTARMIRSAEALSFAYGRQTILAPATSDSPDPGAAGAGVSMDWEEFTSALLDELASFRPRVPVHWSQHNYMDVQYEDPAAASRAKQAIDLLYAKNWKGSAADRSLWLTEGGYNLGSAWTDPAARADQASKIQKSFEAMRTIPDVFMWTQHGIDDINGNDFKSGLRDDFDYALEAPGAARPSWWTWLTLPGPAVL